MQYDFTKKLIKMGYDTDDAAKINAILKTLSTKSDRYYEQRGAIAKKFRIVRGYYGKLNKYRIREDLDTLLEQLGFMIYFDSNCISYILTPHMLEQMPTSELYGMIEEQVMEDEE